MAYAGSCRWRRLVPVEVESYLKKEPEHKSKDLIFELLNDKNYEALIEILTPLILVK